MQTWTGKAWKLKFKETELETSDEEPCPERTQSQENQSTQN